MLPPLFEITQCNINLNVSELLKSFSILPPFFSIKLIRYYLRNVNFVTKYSLLFCYMVTAALIKILASNLLNYIIYIIYTMNKQARLLIPPSIISHILLLLYFYTIVIDKSYITFTLLLFHTMFVYTTYPLHSITIIMLRRILYSDFSIHLSDPLVFCFKNG